MSKIIANGVGYSITEDNGVRAVHVRADKIPNRYGYGHTLESGNATRAFARLKARAYLGASVDVSGEIDRFYIGTSLWRTYRIVEASR